MLRRTGSLAVVLLLLPGCVHEDPIGEPPSGYEGRYWDMMAANPDRPLVWALYHLAGLRPPPEVREGIANQLELVFGMQALRFGGTHLRDEDSDGVWEPAELRALAEALHQELDGPDLPVVFLDGHYSQEADGTVYYGVESNGVGFVFPEQIHSAQIGQILIDHPQAAKVMRSVAVHEMGHALGLVGREAEMQTPRLPSRSDDPCQCHSRHDGSVMYFQAHTGQWYFEPVEGDGSHIIYEFDDDDLADLRQARSLALADAGP